MTNTKTKRKLPKWIDRLPTGFDHSHIVKGKKSEKNKLLVLKTITGNFLILKAYNWHVKYPRRDMYKGDFSNAEYRLTDSEMEVIERIITKLQ